MAVAHRARRCGSDAAKANCWNAEIRPGARRAAGGLIGSPGEFLDDRTVRTIVAATCSNKVLQRTPHRMKRPFAVPQVGNSGRRQRFDIGTRAGSVAPERQQLANLVDWKVKVAGPRDEPQSMHVIGRVIPVLRVRSQRLRRQPDLFIMAHHPRAETRRGRRLADVHQILLDLDTM